MNEFLDLCKDLKIPKAVGMAAIKLVLQIPDEGYRNGVAKSLITRMQLGDFTVEDDTDEEDQGVDFDLDT